MILEHHKASHRVVHHQHAIVEDVMDASSQRRKSHSSMNKESIKRAVNSHDGMDSSSQRRHIQSSKRTLLPLVAITVTIMAMYRLVQQAGFCALNCRNMTAKDTPLKNMNSLMDASLPPEVVNLDVVIGGKSYSLYNPTTDISQALISTHLPLPKPVLIVGMPKAGTTTIHSFFEQAGYRSSHYRCKEEQGVKNLFCGHCIRDAINQSLSPLKSCGDYEVWAQLDVTSYPKLKIDSCYFPQFSDMEILHREAPNATIILNRRDLDHWSISVQNWKNMSYRLSTCEGGPASGSTEDLQQWHKNHIRSIRRFVQKHPSHALVEIDIEDPATAQRMAALFRTKEEYWGHQNINAVKAMNPMSTPP